MIHDVAVIGSGPSGLSLGANLSDTGLNVAIFSPDYYGKWKNNYGVWLDELGAWDLPEGFSEVWNAPQVKFDSQTLTLDRVYARLDNDVIQESWRNRLQAATIHEARVHTVRHEANDATLITDEGEFRARLVIDARGASNPKGHLVAAQTAYGAHLRLKGDPLDGADMMLMDWREAGLYDVPSFLYGMRLGDVYFLEETVLAARPPVSIEQLRQRLFQRLERMGVRVLEVIDEERCFIPLGLPVPPPERKLSIGAAASFVHPATGYSVGRSVAAGLELASLLEAHWADEIVPLTEAAWQVIWPDRARATRRFYELGLEVLLKLEPEKLPDFFLRFFQCPDPLWKAYLSDTGSVGDVAQLMWRVFRNVDADMKWQLARHASMAALLRRSGPHK